MPRVTAERTVMIVGLVSGLLFASVTPPFQVPDEPAHFWRAYQISEGYLLAEKRIIHFVEEGKPGQAKPREFVGGELPASLVRLSTPFTRDLAFQPEKKVVRAMLREAAYLPLEPSNRMFIDFRNTALHTPVPYLPQALALWLGRSANASPLTLLYLARLFNLLISTALAYWAVRNAPCCKWVFASLALTPMAIFLRASVSSDALTNGAAFLLIGFVLSLAFEVSVITTRSVFALLGLVSLVALSKPVYCPLCLLVFLIPFEKFGSSRRAVTIIAAVLVLTASGFALVSWIAVTRYTPLHPALTTDPAEQIRLLLAQPAWFLSVAARSYLQFSQDLVLQFVGNFGWLDTPLDMRLVYAYAAILIALAVINGSRQVAMLLVQRGVLGLVLLSTVLAITIAQYLTWTPVRAEIVEGLQSRYFIPVGPVFLLLFYNRSFAISLTDPRIEWLLFSVQIVSTGFAIATLMSRFYL